MEGNYEIHKVSVEDLCFTCNSDFLVSLGSRDDGNVIVWDVRKSFAICGIFLWVLLLKFRRGLREEFRRNV